jgi:hypothetical protein
VLQLLLLQLWQLVQLLLLLQLWVQLLLAQVQVPGA